MSIIKFWKANPSYWITYSSKQKLVDEIIYNKFWEYEWVAENLISQIIYLDQFSRHFQRLDLLKEEDVNYRRQLAIELIKTHINELQCMDEIEIIFSLMPFKHIKEYNFIFKYLHEEWLPKQNRSKIIEYKDLQKFYIDTYKKAYTLSSIETKIINIHPNIIKYNPNDICEYYPDKQLELDNIDKNNTLLQYLNFTKKVIVSLSGGVDSMVMLTLLKYKKVDVEAVHIIYGNRPESEQEYMFLLDFCNKLGIILNVYRVEWLKRGECDRTFYEDMTRDIRFNVYKSINIEKSIDNSEVTAAPILLGHIKDDIIENIWTNIAHCTHLGNLKKMESSEIQNGVEIIRPFLSVEKSSIYKVSIEVGIPYLKNTTPSWSNRGKFREHFHKATITQYGETIDDKMIEFAEAIAKQNNLINTLLYEPIFRSFQNNTINITTAFNVKLDANNWLAIFEYICHTKFRISRPGIKAIKELCIRLYMDWSDILNIDMGKGLKLKIKRIKHEIYMEFYI